MRTFFGIFGLLVLAVFTNLAIHKLVTKWGSTRAPSSRFLIPESDRTEAFESAYRMLLSAMGRDHLGSLPVGKERTAKELWKIINAAGIPSGHSLGKLTLNELTNRINGKADCPFVVIDSRGLPAIVIGRMTANDVDYFQVVPGMSRFYLCIATKLDELGFTEAWELVGPKAAEINMHIGETSLRIAAPYFNFGETKPFSNNVARFEIYNPSDHVVRFEPPIASCGCTAAVLSGTPECLEPLGRCELVATLSTSDELSKRTAIHVKTIDTQTQVSRTLQFELFASQRPTMTVEPKRLEFGNVRRGSQPKNTLTLTECPGDPFTIKSININNSAIKHSLTTSKTPDGLSRHVIRFAIDYEELKTKPPVGADTVLLKTSSLLRPTVVVPLTYAVLPRLIISPQHIRFSRNSTINQSENVQISSTDGQACDLSLGDVPHGLAVDRLPKSSQFDMRLRVRRLATVEMPENCLIIGTINCPNEDKAEPFRIQVSYSN